MARPPWRPAAAVLDLGLPDLGLPDLDGTAVIAELRTFTHVPIIVLSARTGSTDKVDALDRGADDYGTNPFGVEELVARLRAAVRRAAGSPARQGQGRSASRQRRVATEPAPRPDRW